MSEYDPQIAKMFDRDPSPAATPLLQRISEAIRKRDVRRSRALAVIGLIGGVATFVVLTEATDRLFRALSLAPQQIAVFGGAAAVVVVAFVLFGATLLADREA